MTKRVKIIRDRQPVRTFGKLYVGNTFICDTLEPTDLMMPPGFYVCVPHGWEPNSKFTYKETWALVGKDVSHQPEPNIKHSAVLFHAGNWVRDSRACILPGTKALLENEPAVSSSGKAMDKLRLILGNRSFYLTIEED